MAPPIPEARIHAGGVIGSASTLATAGHHGDSRASWRLAPSGGLEPTTPPRSGGVGGGPQARPWSGGASACEAGRFSIVALDLRRAEQEEMRRTAGEARHKSDFIFTTRYGTPMEPRNFNRFWNRRCHAAGVRRITLRDARRTCAPLLADLDVHPRVAMQILRHAQFAITMEIYTVVSSPATRDALKKLGEALER
jgi:hypothetical protein